MFSIQKFSQSRRRLSIIVLLAGLLLVPFKAVQAAPKYGNSLDWVPADAVFYSASLRLHEQFDIIAKSNAWAKLTNLPAVQMGMGFAQMAIYAPGGPGEQVRDFFNDPDNKELLDLIVDGVSNEILVYGDRSSADFFDVALRTLNAVQYGSMMHNQPGADSEEATGRIVMNSLDARRDRLESPGIVIGFKLTDAQRAQSQLKRLESLVKPILEEEPQFKDRLKRVTVGGVEYLTLELDGSMVPWDEVPWDKLEEKPGQYDKLKQKLHSMRLVVSIGVRDNYLLFSTGGSTAHLAELGKGKLLADSPEFQALTKFADQRLTGVSFISKDMLQVFSNSSRDLDQLVQVVRQALPAAGLPPELNEKILKDATELADDLKGAIPEPGAAFAFSFLTPQGIEGYQYNWTQNLYLDGSKPLDLLNHVGGSPLLAFASRAKHSPQQYELMQKWLTKAFGYFEELALPQFSPEEREKYSKIKAMGMPLVQRLDKATGQMLLPALADGQTAIVLDAKQTSKKWFKEMPESDQALPMLDIAVVFSVSDADLLKKAFTEYQSIADATVEQIKTIEPDAIPAGFKLPLPEQKSSNVGSIYQYPFPAECGVDPNLAFNAGLGSHVAVVSFEPMHTTKLLTDTPLEVSPNGPLADRSRPLAAAAYFNWAGTVDAASPWIDYAVMQLAPRAAEGAGVGALLVGDEAQTQFAQAGNADPHTKFVLDQVHTFLDVLKVLHTVECATYFEGGATVSHSLSIYKDVP